MSFNFKYCVYLGGVLLSTLSLRSADPLEVTVAELLDTRTEIVSRQKEYDVLLHEHNALTNRIVMVEQLAEDAQHKNSVALQNLAEMESLVSNLWTRVPASCRTNAVSYLGGQTPPLHVSPETRISTLRRDLQALGKLHSQYMYGRDTVSVNVSERRLCDILTLGLSCAVAVSDDDSFAAIAVPAQNETWQWTPTPTRVQEIRAVIRAYQQNKSAIYPIQ